MNEHSGHRNRLKQRFMRAGRGGLSEHELLELLLFYAIPRRDVKPIAKLLLNRFGSLEAVLSADREQLLLTDGIGENSTLLIKLISTIAVELMTKTLHSGSCLAEREKLQQYLTMKCRGQESVQLLLLDQKSCLLDVLCFEGGMKNVEVFSRDMLLKVLACRGARQVIIAHNHLNNNPSPSKTDIQTTVRLKYLFGSVGITLLDHYIITPDHCVSIMKTP